MTSEQTEDVTDAPHQEVRSNGERVIVVNSQPKRGEQELPPRRMRSLGSVAAHATDPVTGGDSRPRRGSSRRGKPLLSILMMALPLIAAAFVISLLDGRTVILAATAALALIWLVGIVAAWRGLGPGSRDNRGGTWLGRAIGLVLGALVAVYLLLDTVSPLL